MWILKNFKAKPFGILGCVLVFLTIFAAIFADFISPYDKDHMELHNRLKPPFWANGGEWKHPLGTDSMGRDILSRLIHGARGSMIIGISAAAIALFIGVSLGLLSGYIGGNLDRLIMHMVDAMLALPGTMLAILLVAIIGPHQISVILALGMTMWSEYAKVIRARVLTLKEEPFVLASKAFGISNIGIISKHLLPNIAHIIVIVFTIQIGLIILWAAALNFIGFGGVTVSWGWDIAAGRIYISHAWWLPTFPGIALSISVLGFILIGDWLRDVLDPKLL